MSLLSNVIAIAIAFSLVPLQRHQSDSEQLLFYQGIVDDNEPLDLLSYYFSGRRYVTSTKWKRWAL